MHIPRIFPQKQRLQRTQNGSEARSKKAFPKSPNALIRFDPNQRPIEIALYDSSLKSNDFQDSPIFK